jgi:DNA-binding MarR family transcriptional regulator
MGTLPFTVVLQDIWAARDLDAHAKLLLIYLAESESKRQPWVRVRDAARALGLRPSRVLAALYRLHGQGYIRLGMEDTDSRQWFRTKWTGWE